MKSDFQMEACSSPAVASFISFSRLCFPGNRKPLWFVLPFSQFLEAAGSSRPLSCLNLNRHTPSITPGCWRSNTHVIQTSG